MRLNLQYNIDKVDLDDCKKIYWQNVHHRITSGLVRCLKKEEEDDASLGQMYENKMMSGLVRCLRTG